MKINTSKATGHDRISPKLLKDSADIIAESLTVIFNKSIETGIFPDDLKVACISPIYKGESKTECSNYRQMNGEYLENISSLFVVKNNENYNLRNNNIDYKLEKPKTNFLKKKHQLFRCKNLE